MIPHLVLNADGPGSSVSTPPYLSDDLLPVTLLEGLIENWTFART